MKDKYQALLEAKVRLAKPWGFSLDEMEINPALKPHNRAMVKWLVEGGRRACFASFGLHKTVTQLETVRLTLEKSGGRGLIVLPLGVRQEFRQDAKNVLGWEDAPPFIRRIEEADATGIYLTNYQTIRDGKMDPREFTVASLDEASVLRGFGGSKTFREFMRLFTGDGGPLGDRRGTACVPYRFVATATPSPNEYIELLAYADFLGIMDVSQAKTRFFKRDSTKADKLTLHAHKEEEFWLWVSSWALFVQKPSDLGFSDEGYELPPLDIRWHELPVDHSEGAGMRRDGQMRMFRDSAIGIQDAAREKRNSLDARIEKLQELRACRYCGGAGEVPESCSRYMKCPDCEGRGISPEHRVIWHDLEDERRAIEKAAPSAVSIYGSQDLDKREQVIVDFSNGQIQEIASKLVITGSGCNFQKHCAWEIFLGVGYKFNDFIQGVHRVQRFGQKQPVRIDIIYTEAEREVRKTLERKWRQHDEMVQKMAEIIQKFGLSQKAMAQTLTRKIGVERVEIIGENHRLVNWDSVLETKQMPTDDIGFILTSWPFSTQYEYSPNFSDFGHNDNNEAFFEQMDHLTPECLRILQPGRLMAVHVKDRIVPGGLNGLGMQTVYPFHAECISHCIRHGFAYMGMITITTDVVRENNQTYRLSYTEQCKDGSKMSVGMPEYLLLFRKPQTDSTRGYADVPVVKQKRSFIGRSNGSPRLEGEEYEEVEPHWNNADGYSLSRWQLDAHSFWKSSGDRLLTPDDFEGMDHKQMFRLFRAHNFTQVYDYETHVRIGEGLEARGKLPTDFMLLQPQSWHSAVWSEITRMRTLNGAQSAKGKEMHLCPFQFDTVSRAIKRWSNPGDKVFDPFGGIMTVPYLAVQLGRYGIGCELSPSYFLDGAAYCQAAEMEINAPSLFDLTELEETPETQPELEKLAA